MLDTTCDAMASLSGTPAPTSSPERSLNGRFAPGHRGVSPGRPIGTRGRSNVAMESLLDGEAEALTGRMIALALSGDVKALKFCLERLLPRMTSLPVNIDLPEVKTLADVQSALTTLIDATFKGEIETIQAKHIATLLDMKRRSFETVDLEERLTLIEKKVSRDQRAL